MNNLILILFGCINQRTFARTRIMRFIIGLFSIGLMVSAASADNAQTGLTITDSGNLPEMSDDPQRLASGGGPGTDGSKITGGDLMNVPGGVQSSEGQQVAGLKQDTVVVEGEDKKGSHLHLVLEISKDGSSTKVISAVRLAGAPLLSDQALGDNIYKMELNGKAVAVTAVPDPFQMRSYASEDDPEAGHFIDSAKTGIIVMKVAEGDKVLAQINRLQLRAYKLKPGAEVYQMDLNVMKKLGDSNRLSAQGKATRLKFDSKQQQQLKKIYQ